MKSKKHSLKNCIGKEWTLVDKAGDLLARVEWEEGGFLRVMDDGLSMHVHPNHACKLAMLILEAMNYRYGK